MKNSSHILELISVDSDSKTPKYRQLVSSVLYIIERKQVVKGDKMPSINELSEWFYLSRDTVEKAYKALKKQGVLTSVPGKGNYIDRVDVQVKHKVFLLFNKLSTHKKAIYDSFIARLGNLASVDFYIYNNDFRTYEAMILDSLGKYDYYVIMPHFNIENVNAQAVLNQVPQGKLILMDKMLEGLSNQPSMVYQHYENDIYKALITAKEVFANYIRLVLVFPDVSYHPKTICKGFLKVAGELELDKLITKSILISELRKGDVLVLVEENDLIEAIKNVRSNNWQIGKDVALISYNETPIKEVLADGISVISTDFAAMGSKVAEVILANQKVKIENPFRLIRRKSF